MPIPPTMVRTRSAPPGGDIYEDSFVASVTEELEGRIAIPHSGGQSFLWPAYVTGSAAEFLCDAGTGGLRTQGGGDNLCYCPEPAGTADMFVEVTFNVSGASVGPAVRINSTAGNGYAVAVSGSNLLLYRIDGVAGTIIANPFSTGFVDGDRIRFEAIGSTLRVALNGGPFSAHVDATYTTGQYGGIWKDRNRNVVINDFSTGAA